MKPIHLLYHLLLCYDGLTGDLIRAQLRDGTDYCSKDSAAFMAPVISEYRNHYPDIQLYARGDSCFATPELYDLFEDFIGEGKQGFDFASVSSKSKTVNANRLQLHALVYNIFNWFRRLVLPKHMNRNLIDTVRLKLLKIATKVVHTGRYVKF